MMKDPNVCPEPERMGKHACRNRSQCWELCGDLGHDPRHAFTEAQARRVEVTDLGPVDDDVLAKRFMGAGPLLVQP